jgi:hypothetical protein
LTQILKSRSETKFGTQATEWLTANTTSSGFWLRVVFERGFGPFLQLAGWLLEFAQH